MSHGMTRSKGLLQNRTQGAILLCVFLLMLSNFRGHLPKVSFDQFGAHERFNASAWQDLEQNPNPERAIIAFLDYDTCQLIHWPKFAGYEFNADT